MWIIISSNTEWLWQFLYYSSPPGILIKGPSPYFTLLKRLASARHDNREKTVLLPDCTLQTKQSMKTKEVDDVFSRRPLYCGRAGSDVIGCRWPTSGVFVCMLQTRVTLTLFPIATPRGRSSKFPWKGTTSYAHSFLCAYLWWCDQSMRREWRLTGQLKVCFTDIQHLIVLPKLIWLVYLLRAHLTRSWCLGQSWSMRLKSLLFDVDAKKYTGFAS